jgi:hypothetical protein
MKAILADQRKGLSSDGSLIPILTGLFSDLDVSLSEEECLAHGMVRCSQLIIYMSIAVFDIVA